MGKNFIASKSNLSIHTNLIQPVITLMGSEEETVVMSEKNSFTFLKSRVVAPWKLALG